MSVLSYRRMPEALLTAMRDTSPLTVEVSELLRDPGSSKTLSFERPVAGLALPLARVDEGAALRFDLRLEALVDGIHVEGTVSGDVSLECRRCLTMFARPTSVTVDTIYLYPGEDGDDDDDDGETYAIVDETVDLEPAVRDAVLLELPLNPVCREDCKGLCPTCGADLNEKNCGHEGQRSDIRWSALEELRRSMED